MENNTGINVLSLFDGMSCGRIALDRAGIKVNNYFASEIDTHAIKVAQKNYPHNIQLGDVTKVKSEGLPQIDLLLGGSPCQGFSCAGKMLNFDDPRSNLFFEFVRLWEETKPKYFLLENVRMKKECQEIISSYLGVTPIAINSNLVSAQDRARLYWTNIPNIEQPKDKGLYLKDIMEEEVEKKYNVTERFYRKVEGTTSYKKSRGNCRSPDRKAKTLTTGGHGISNSGATNIKIDENFIRIPTPVECERLQTVPDNYTKAEGLRDSHRYKMLGNGWTVDVIAHILQHIKR